MYSRHVVRRVELNGNTETHPLSHNEQLCDLRPAARAGRFRHVPPPLPCFMCGARQSVLKALAVGKEKEMTGRRDPQNTANLGMTDS